MKDFILILIIAFFGFVSSFLLDLGQPEKVTVTLEEYLRDSDLLEFPIGLSEGVPAVVLFEMPEAQGGPVRAFLMRGGQVPIPLNDESLKRSLLWRKKRSCSQNQARPKKTASDGS